MFKNIFDKGLLDFNLADISKIRKDMENKRIEMSAMDFMSVVPLSFVIDDYSDKEKTGALKFAAAVVYLNTTGEGKMMLDAYLRRMKEKLSEKLAQTEIPPENTVQEEPKKDEPAADTEQEETEKSKLPEYLQKLLDDPDVPEKIKKAIRGAADADADIEVIRVKGKKG